MYPKLKFYLITSPRRESGYLPQEVLAVGDDGLIYNQFSEYRELECQPFREVLANLPDGCTVRELTPGEEVAL